MRYSANSNLIISSPILARASVNSRSSGTLRVFNPRAATPGEQALLALEARIWRAIRELLPDFEVTADAASEQQLVLKRRENS